ncbi:MAG: alpha/beta hydrolase, partial [Desulfobulbia bacterium]
AFGTKGEIPLRLYIPRDPGNESMPCLIYFHGGGFMLGGLNSHDVPCRHLSLAGDCMVIAVEYRKAPEFPFPEPVEDSWDALEWIVGHIESLGGDKNRIALGGDSAGGNIAAVLALRARDRGEPQICYQLLIYPSIDMTRSFPSHVSLASGFRLTKPLIDYFYDNYFSGEVPDRRHPLCSPLFVKDVSGLPPAYIVSAGYDPLRDENIAYHEKLLSDGVESIHRHYEGMIHGFINLTAFLDASQKCLESCGQALKQGFRSAVELC